MRILLLAISLITLILVIGCNSQPNSGIGSVSTDNASTLTTADSGNPVSTKTSSTSSSMMSGGMMGTTGTDTSMMQNHDSTKCTTHHQ